MVLSGGCSLVSFTAALLGQNNVTWSVPSLSWTLVLRDLQPLFHVSWQLMDQGQREAGAACSVCDAAGQPQAVPRPPTGLVEPTKESINLSCKASAPPDGSELAMSSLPQGAFHHIQVGSIGYF